MLDPVPLGRSVVVGPGDPAPGEWSSCERITVTTIDPAVADEISAAWRERRPVVIELMPGVGIDDPENPPPEVVTGRQPWEWPVDLDLVGARLHHAVWANSVDARSGIRPSRWTEEALRLGAGVGSAGSDITLPDGTPAVCDGGPLDATLAERVGVPVVHRISLEHGVLRPFGPNDPVGVALAADQLEAVTEPGAGARVIAPAGSGKTRVLTERARLLLSQWRLPPESVALVAYNVRAAGEMKERLTDVEGVRVRTLNALGLRLCGRRSTIEEIAVRRLLGGLVAFPKRAETDPAAPWLEALGRVRLGLVDPETVESELPDVSDLDRVARAYRAQLAEQDVVDFDEQVTGAIERLLGDPVFRLRSQRFARVLLVDEFQDLTPAHLLLIRLLTGPAGSVFAVGDDDQTIYGYAGATPRWLVDFRQWFPGGGNHSLEVNYRCPASVVTAASNLLTRNALRVPKVIRSVDGAVSPPMDGNGLHVLTGADGPATRTARRVRELLEEGAMPTGVAVLARVNASLAPVQILLRHDGIPVQGAVDSRFLQRGGVRAALAWLSVATAHAGTRYGPTLREAARRPKRGMSASLLDLVAKQHSANALDSLAGWLERKGSDREADKIRSLSDDVDLVRKTAEGATTADILAVVRSRVGDGGLDASATALDRWSHGAIAPHADDLDALVELADLEPEPTRFPGWLSEQLGHPSDHDGVTLASIHAVKGREWPHVVVHHATAGLLPHRLAEDIEEERRVFHVALTRCCQSVSIVPGSQPSPFLLELSQPGTPPPSRSATRVRPPSPAPERSGKTASTGSELVPASVGLLFAYRGHDHEVTDITDPGVRAQVGSGPATTAIKFGTPVTAAGRTVTLAHPRCVEAWERLRGWRTERARTLGKPAFTVFDDKTLRLVAAVLPTTEAGLLAIAGIGPVKLETYGSELISITEQLRAVPS